MTWLIYILFCDQKTYYVGLTGNLKKRIESHRKKQNIATKEYSTIKLVHVEKYNKRKEAEKREKQIKGWSRVKKKALIKGDIELLKKLSRNLELGDGVPDGK